MPRPRMSRWPLIGLTVIHRVGRIPPGENIVLVRDGVDTSPGARSRPPNS